MTLWRLELLRLVRSYRWIILAAVFGFFGILGPLTARFLPDIVERFDDSGLGMPEMGPPDGITQYVGSAQQFGLIAIAFVAAAALAIDSNTELSVFFRTRVSMRDLFTPRFVVNSIAGALAFAFGAAIAYVGTGVLLAWLDFGSFAIGVALQCVYLVFAVAVVALAASIVRKTISTAVLAIGVLILLGILTVVPPIAPWLPSDLAGALDGLIRGGDFEYWRALAVTVVLIVVLPIIAINRLGHREV
jgi:ABC-2 type transport system permease protein